MNGMLMELQNFDLYSLVDTIRKEVCPNFPAAPAQIWIWYCMHAYFNRRPDDVQMILATRCILCRSASQTC